MLSIMFGSKLMKNVISKLIARTIRKKHGYKMDVNVKDLDIREGVDEYVTLKLSTEIKISKSELERLLNSINGEADV